ncbi:hypothetical protein UY3_16396 [Chelonia mydas]|uniref:Uncharacterized protein n=1 Tax=Chelonia mydas TaxID=8469 RepID=M7APL8_CHEMY|nr:hypothetical protein UY3_16396 [Chelonia mydas]
MANHGHWELRAVVPADIQTNTAVTLKPVIILQRSSDPDSNLSSSLNLYKVPVPEHTEANGKTPTDFSFTSKL